MDTKKLEAALIHVRLLLWDMQLPRLNSLMSFLSFFNSRLVKTLSKYAGDVWQVVRGQAEKPM